MAHESFTYGETQPLFKKLEEVSHRAGVSRGQAFDDFLTASVAALAAETMEDDYLAMVERHKSGSPGKRSIDLIATMFGQLINAMSQTDGDVLGDFFQSAISYQESGQFLTPDTISQLMAQLSVGDAEQTSDGSPFLISDPCCGTGRMLLHAARQHSSVELFGQDIDARCVRISAINIGLRNHYGWVVCGNTLTCENRFAYRIAPFYHESPRGTRRGVIRSVPVNQTPALQKPVSAESSLTFEAVAENSSLPETTDGLSLPTIMEIPRWLARIEQHLEIKEPDSTTSQPTPPSSPQAEGPEPSGYRGPMTQGELF